MSPTETITPTTLKYCITSQDTMPVNTFLEKVSDVIARPELKLPTTSVSTRKRGGATDVTITINGDNNADNIRARMALTSALDAAGLGSYMGDSLAP